MKNIIYIISSVTLLLSGCGNKKNNFDATGSFEADEVIISSEANGVIKSFNIEEGQSLAAGETIGYIDSTQLFLRKKQLKAQIEAILSKRPNVGVQISALEEQLKTAEKEQQRISNLVKADAGTTKQLDDINSSIAVIKKQIDAQQSGLNITSDGLSKETIPLDVQIEQLNDQLAKCRLVNPIKGTVLTKYAEANEMSAVGKALYKIADLSTMILRVYISGDQLTQLKLNQTVKVRTDNGKGDFEETEGKVIWINDKAEFTPKTIQTKDERANMVYAVKVLVKNNGTYKIGMYGEIKFE